MIEFLNDYKKRRTNEMDVSVFLNYFFPRCSIILCSFFSHSLSLSLSHSLPLSLSFSLSLQGIASEFASEESATIADDDDDNDDFEIKNNKNEYDDDYEDDDGYEAPIAKTTARKKREAVSSEPVRAEDMKNVKARVIPKSEEERDQIIEYVRNAMLFKHLDSSQLSTVAGAMEKKKFIKGEAIIRQGDDGDLFFILAEGECDCFITDPKSKQQIKIKTYSEGDCFGELALMYNCPRAATITAASDVSTWGLDRNTFRQVMYSSSNSKAERYENLLSSVKILASLDKHERAKIADALTEKEFEDGDYIIEQGDDQDHNLYFLAEGEARATKVLDGMDEEPVEVMRYKRGDYFGELALIYSAPRAANVIAVGDAVKVVCLDRASVNRLLGPVDSILKRNSDNYAQVEKMLQAAKLATAQAHSSHEQQVVDRRQRKGVSAEQTHDEDASWEPKIIPKSDAQRDRISSAIRKNFLFSTLEPEQRELVLLAMFEAKFRPGERVITQGESGDNFYVIESGSLDCNVNGRSVKTYVPGESFGELALMYNCPRAATITAQDEVVLWAMDRMTFRRVIMGAAAKKRQMYESFLDSIPLLSSLDRYERAKVADALTTASFKDGEHVIRQGEAGDAFYIVESGAAVATKELEAGKGAVPVKDYAKGGYFGELALINNAPRAANVIAVGTLQLARLDRESFSRLLGPCEDILKRNRDYYATLDLQVQNK
jgi:CRP-like cAMP-binding protein